MAPLPPSLHYDSHPAPSLSDTRVYLLSRAFAWLPIPFAYMDSPSKCLQDLLLHHLQVVTSPFLLPSLYAHLLEHLLPPKILLPILNTYQNYVYFLGFKGRLEDSVVPSVFFFLVRNQTSFF